MNFENKHLNEVIEIFSQISKIPRCSKKEEKIAKFLVNFAFENNLEYKIDSYNNVIIKVPPTKGYEELPGIVIQTHMDMVCEKKEGSNHDFSKDPIEIIFDGDFIKAKDTTLGADDGIGMSIALSFAKLKEGEHPLLELLFTVDEETGLTGAKMIEKDFISSNYMLNIDTDDDKTFIIGCAGGKDVKLEYNTNFSYSSINENQNVLEISIDNLKGGHSGLDINKKRANAIILVIRILNYLLDKEFNFFISSLNGGQAHNAIPRSAKAIIIIDKDNKNNIISEIKYFANKLKEEINIEEPNFSYSLNLLNSVDKTFFLNNEESKKLIHFLNLIPHGVFTMSSEIDGLVESSNNFAKIETNYKQNKIFILLSYRSSNDNVMGYALSKITSLSKLTSSSIEIGNGYPSWKPNINSKFLRYCKESYKDCFNEYPKVDVIHAGLECGILLSKFPKMEVLSCGVKLDSPHSPLEKVSISSIEHTLKFITKLFKNWKNYF
jgi:dipeptidase D